MKNRFALEAFWFKRGTHTKVPFDYRGRVLLVTNLFPALSLSRSLGQLVGVAAIIAMMPAQGCGAGIAECTLDADCDQGLACELSECVPVCTSDADCRTDEACLRGLTTERRVCQVDDGAQGTGVRSAFAVVRDVTEGEGCATEHPGADISFVLLEDVDGEVVAWGRVVQTEITTQSEYSTSAHIDGDRPEWGADSCPEFLPDHVIALGCAGSITLEFVDEMMAQVGAKSGEHRLRVGEFGGQCQDGDDADRYEVLLCPGGENVDDLPQGCTVSVGVGQGERAFDI